MESILKLALILVPELTVPNTNYFADNVTLHCAGDAPETVSILWRMRCASCEFPQDVYSGNARSADRSRAMPEFAANVTGVFVEGLYLQSLAYNTGCWNRI